ncbi:MAG TPA: hypothetical protein VGL71_12560 [Urbifossiella sp.]|jgi:hypothetical protein
MAEMIIMLRRDKTSGKQNIIVKLDSDPDALPMEHEQLHRKLVEQLVGKGIDAEDLGEIIIERESQGSGTIAVENKEPTEKRAAKSKG